MLFKAKDIYESLSFSLISILRKAGNPLADCLRFIIFHFFSRRNPSLPYGCTATKRIFDDSAHFYLSPSHRDAKKVQTEKVKGQVTFLVKEVY